MSTLTTLYERVPKVRAKYVLFAFVSLMMAYVLRHNEHFLIDSKDPIWQHYQPFKWKLLPHGLAGACALLLGPMQFSDRLRHRFAKFHRIAGRFYVAGVFIAAPLGFYIQHFEERIGGTRSFTVLAAVDATLWMITTGIAFACILKGKVEQHRRWMTRSFAVAIVFLEIRVVAGITGWDTMPNVIETVGWVCLAFAILLADIALQWQDLRRTRPIPAKVKAASISA